MEQLSCPHCRSTEIDREARLVASDRSTTVGRWRLKYGLVSALAAMLFGVLCAFASWRWFDPPMNEAAIIIAVLSFMFAIFVLATTLYFSRWTDATEYR